MNRLVLVSVTCISSLRPGLVAILSFVGLNNVVKLLQQSPLLSPGQSLFLVVFFFFFFLGGGGQDLALLLVSSSELQHNHSSHK